MLFLHVVCGRAGLELHFLLRMFGATFARARHVSFARPRCSAMQCRDFIALYRTAFSYFRFQWVSSCLMLRDAGRSI